MEEVIYAFGKSLGSFCNSLQASCDGLKQSIERRPVPLDPASTTFIRNLNRRLSAAGRDLNHLESMSFGTVSLEELLGHCNEVYKKNQSDVLEIEDQLRSYGYVPEVENDDDDQDRALESELNDDGPFNSSSPDLEPGKNAVVKILDEEDPLMDESLSLKSFGLSDVCLASLTSGGNHGLSRPHISVVEPQRYDGDPNGTIQAASKTSVAIEDETDSKRKPDYAPKRVIELSKDSYEGLPSYMKNLTPWEDLVSAVEKINLSMSKKEGVEYFLQEEVDSLGLGPKSRTYILLLIRMKHLVVETTNGSISYRTL
ncbi:unnamed protein product [Linum tenue]|uniref:Spindle and kinetochore-associated protein 3 n=2 Tax=Linum tenue TaxID=586396 RepID=A0AAV0J0U5_9ROSI|nr:unnamed protein product [Linum tenue]